MTCDLHGYDLVDGGICPECNRLANQAAARQRRAERRNVRERISPTPRDPDEIEPGYWDEQIKRLIGVARRAEDIIKFDGLAELRAADDGWREP